VNIALIRRARARSVNIPNNTTIYYTNNNNDNNDNILNDLCLSFYYSNRCMKETDIVVKGGKK